MEKSLASLMQDAEMYLASQQYSDSSIKQYKIKWRKFELFCQTNGIEYPNREIGEQFVKEYERNKPPKKSHRFMLSKAIHLLFDVQAGEGLKRKNVNERYFLPAQFSAQLDEFRSTLEAKQLAKATIKGQLFQAKRFLSWLGEVPILDVASIAPDHIYGYVSSIGWMRPQSITDTLFILRGFLVFLCESCGADPALATLFSVIKVNKNSSLPSTYTQEEITRLLEALNVQGRCARRDRAIMLLAAQHGLRIGDILGLRIKDIDWSLMQITVAQNKTNHLLSLPLQEESAFAIIDYLKNERPNIESPYIFLTHCAPFTPLAGTNACQHTQISALFENCGVNTYGKHHGFHSIRHSLAANMLKAKTPLPVLSEVLGHSSTDATRVYIKVDVERLRTLSLEVPRG